MNPFKGRHFQRDIIHTFSELSVFDSKGWDYAIKSKIEFLTKREEQCLDSGLGSHR